MYIKYFAWIKDITLCDQENLDSNKLKTISDLKVYLINKYPNLREHIDNDLFRFAINQEYVFTKKQIYKNDEIAIFPPVSGG